MQWRPSKLGVSEVMILKCREGRRFGCQAACSTVEISCGGMLYSIVVSPLEQKIMKIPAYILTILVWHMSGGMGFLLKYVVEAVDSSPDLDW
jgi:hypothetical protein